MTKSEAEAGLDTLSEYLKGRCAAADGGCSLFGLAMLLRTRLMAIYGEGTKVSTCVDEKTREIKVTVKPPLDCLEVPVYYGGRE